MAFQTIPFSLQRCCQAAALLVLAGLVALVGSPARAATASASFNVTVSVVTVCSVAATDLAFGAYNAAALVDTLSLAWIDRDASYLNCARRSAAAEGLTNIEFQTGDVLALPFEKASFDVVWSKHLLQWVAGRTEALDEFDRVTRPGGRVVCSNFDGFCLAHYPTDEQVQGDVEHWFSSAKAEFRFDTNLGRKLPHLFKAAGLKDIRFEIIPDRAFCGFGGDPERRWNWQTQWQSAVPFTTKVFGGEDAARVVTARVIQRFNGPDVFVYTTLFYVEGIVS